jgi:hypothetical protein
MTSDGITLNTRHKKERKSKRVLCNVGIVLPGVDTLRVLAGMTVVKQGGKGWVVKGGYGRYSRVSVNYQSCYPFTTLPGGRRR